MTPMFLAAVYLMVWSNTTTVTSIPMHDMEQCQIAYSKLPAWTKAVCVDTGFRNDVNQNWGK